MENSNFGYNLQLKLHKDEIFFGKGICDLLDLVAEHKSLNLAALKMGMAYSKAWKIVKKAEKSLGYALLTRQIGGASGGGSSITAEGEIFIAKYKAMRDELNAQAQVLFEKYFEEML